MEQNIKNCKLGLRDWLLRHYHTRAAELGHWVNRKKNKCNAGGLHQADSVPCDRKPIKKGNNVNYKWMKVIVFHRIIQKWYFNLKLL